jgi:uncharacterized membrane protein
MSKAWMIVAILLAVWTIPWKGLALWKSAKRGDRVWFIFLLLINTLGVLEIIYIFFFSKEKQKEPETLNECQPPKKII